MYTYCISLTDTLYLQTPNVHVFSIKSLPSPHPTGQQHLHLFRAQWTVRLDLVPPYTVHKDGGSTE